MSLAIDTVEPHNKGQPCYREVFINFGAVSGSFHMFVFTQLFVPTSLQNMDLLSGELHKQGAVSDSAHQDHNDPQEQND